MRSNELARFVNFLCGNTKVLRDLAKLMKSKIFEVTADDLHDWRRRLMSGNTEFIKLQKQTFAQIARGNTDRRHRLNDRQDELDRFD